MMRRVVGLLSLIGLAIAMTAGVGALTQSRLDGRQIRFAVVQDTDAIVGIEPLNSSYVVGSNELPALFIVKNQAGRTLNINATCLADCGIFATLDGAAVIAPGQTMIVQGTMTAPLASGLYQPRIVIAADSDEIHTEITRQTNLLVLVPTPTPETSATPER